MRADTQGATLLTVPLLDRDAVALVLRLTLGVVIFPHGAQKLLGWFGGPGFSATMAYFTGALHVPAFLAVVVILGESIGAVALILGLLTRVAALGIAIDMLVTVLLVHVRNGFFMNWAGDQHGEGFEFHILAIGLALAIFVNGPGRWSVDRRVFDERRDLG